MLAPVRLPEGLARAYVIAIDIGGTFTDLVACDVETGAVAYTKSPTTYGRLGEAIFDCIRKARSMRAMRASSSTAPRSSSTRCCSAIGAKTALLTTKGFRDVLEIGRGNRTQPFNLRFHREPPLIPRELRFEIEERIDGSGQGAHAARRSDELGALAANAAVATRSRRWRSASSTRTSTPDHEQAAAASCAGCCRTCSSPPAPS